MAIELADSDKRLHKKAIKQWNAAFEGIISSYVNQSVLYCCVVAIHDQRGALTPTHPLNTTSHTNASPQHPLFTYLYYLRISWSCSYQSRAESHGQRHVREISEGFCGSENTV